MTFVRYKKFGKQEYAYEVKAFWDAKKKRPVQKTKYLGVVIDKERGIFEKRSITTEKCILDFGDSYAVQNYLDNTGLTHLVEKVFGDKSDSLLALLSYKLCYGSAMVYASRWMEGNYALLKFKNASIVSQRISELFRHIGEEHLQRKFLREYLSKFVDAKSGIIIDATSLPNQIHMPLTAWGLRGEEIDKQIRFLLVVDRLTHYPIMFRMLPGNVVDVSTLQNTLEELKKYDVKRNFVCIDAGFFSEDNIKEMYDNEIPFLTRLPSIRTAYKELVREEIPHIESTKNGVKYGKRGLFVKQKEIELFGKKVYAHIVLDPQRKGRETSKFLLNMIDEKDAHDEQELDYSLMNRGVMILVSSVEVPKNEIVQTYYLRQTVETLFGFSKDDLGILPLRVHSEETLRGFLFVQFLALIAFIQLREKLIPDYTVEEALLIMRNLKCKVYDNEILVNELTKQQKDIAKRLNILVPKKAGI